MLLGLTDDERKLLGFFGGGCLWGRECDRVIGKSDGRLGCARGVCFMTGFMAAAMRYDVRLRWLI